MTEPRRDDVGPGRSIGPMKKRTTDRMREMVRVSERGFEAGFEAGVELVVSKLAAGATLEELQEWNEKRKARIK